MDEQLELYLSLAVKNSNPVFVYARVYVYIHEYDNRLCEEFVTYCHGVYLLMAAFLIT
jgi:hypothetical protein